MSGWTRSLTMRVINMRKRNCKWGLLSKMRGGEVGQRKLTHRQALSESPLLPSDLLSLRSSSSVDEMATGTKSVTSRHYQCPLMSAVLSRGPGLLHPPSCSRDGGRSLVPVVSHQPNSIAVMGKGCLSCCFSARPSVSRTFCL